MTAWRDEELLAQKNYKTPFTISVRTPCYIFFCGKGDRKKNYFNIHFRLISNSKKFCYLLCQKVIWIRSRAVRKFYSKDPRKKWQQQYFAIYSCWLKLLFYEIRALDNAVVAKHNLRKTVKDSKQIRSTRRSRSTKYPLFRQNLS